MNAFDVSIGYTSMDYGILGAEFYITSSTNGEQEFQATIYADTGIEACEGISAFIMNDIRNGHDVLAACPVFWSVECSDGQVCHLLFKTVVLKVCSGCRYFVVVLFDFGNIFVYFYVNPQDCTTSSV